MEELLRSCTLKKWFESTEATIRSPSGAAHIEISESPSVKSTRVSEEPVLILTTCSSNTSLLLTVVASIEAPFQSCVVATSLPTAKPEATMVEVWNPDCVLTMCWIRSSSESLVRMCMSEPSNHSDGDVVRFAVPSSSPDHPSGFEESSVL